MECKMNNAELEILNKIRYSHIDAFADEIEMPDHDFKKIFHLAFCSDEVIKHCICDKVSINNDNIYYKRIFKSTYFYRDYSYNVYTCVDSINNVLYYKIKKDRAL